MSKLDDLERDLAAVLNKHGVDNMVGMPDFIVASYCVTCISALKSAHVKNTVHKAKEDASNG